MSLKLAEMKREIGAEIGAKAEMKEHCNTCGATTGSKSQPFLDIKWGEIFF